jgi:hypothetical protein
VTLIADADGVDVVDSGKLVAESAQLDGRGLCGNV